MAFSFQEALGAPSPADDPLVNAVIAAESAGRPDAVSPKGARGLMQLMPATAAELGVDPDDPVQNVEGGARYLNQMRTKYGDTRTALMAYNWGPGNVDRWIAGGRQGPVPQETRAYVNRVMAQLQGAQPGPSPAVAAAPSPAPEPAAEPAPAGTGMLARFVNQISPVGSAQAQTMPAQTFGFEEAKGEKEPEAPASGSIFSFEEALGPGEFTFEDAQKPQQGVVGAAAAGLRGGFRQLGEQAQTLFGLGTGNAADQAPPLPDDFEQRYADKSFLQKLTDPTWLAHFLPQTIVGSAPFLAGAGAGAAAGSAVLPGVGTLIGGMIGGGTTAGLQALADAYNEARRAGKGHDEAVDYAMGQGLASAGLSAATLPLGLWGAAKGPVSYVLKQMAAQPAAAAGQQAVSNVIAQQSGIDPNRSVLAGMPEAALGAAAFQAPVTAKVARSIVRDSRRVGEEPPAPPPGQPVEGGPQTGQRFNLGLEEATSDPATGKTTQTVTPADVTVQGFDPETGLVSLTLDDGRQLGPMALEDFERLKTGDEPGPPPTEAPPAAKVGPTAEEAAATNAEISAAEDRGMAQPTAERAVQPKRPWGVEPTAEDIERRNAEIAAAEAEGRVVRPPESEGPSPFARPAKPREEETPPPRLDLGDEDARVREGAAEADRLAEEAARVEAEERAAIQEEGGTVRKTDTGAYELSGKDGEALGAYTTKKAATEAAADRTRSERNADAAKARADETADAAAKVTADATPKGKVPEAAAKMTERMEPRRAAMKELGLPEAKGIFPRTLAKLDRGFSRLYGKVEKMTEDQYRNFRDFFWQSKPLGKLSTPSRTQVHKAAVLARLQGRNIVPSGARLVIVNSKMKDRPGTGEAIVNPDTHKVWLEPGETVRLSKEETEAFFALKATMQNVWSRHIEAVARHLGYEGDIKELRAAITEARKSDEARAAAEEKYGDLVEAIGSLMDQERAGYVPLQRRGDVQISVMPKPKPGEGRASAGDLGGMLEPLWSQMVDTGTLKKSMFGRRSVTGDFGKKVEAAVAELRKRFPDAKVLDPRYVSEIRQEDLAIPALQRLIHGLESRNPELRDAAWKEFKRNITEKARAGFRQRAENVPGFSVDFDRVLTEHLHHAARVLPMIEHRNAVASAKERLMGDTTKKIAPEASPSVRKFAERWLDYVEDPGGDFSAIRKLGFGWWLWASPSSAIVNLTQTPLVTVASVGKWGGYTRAFYEANKVAAALLMPNRLLFKKSQWSGDGGKIILDIDNVRLGVSEEERSLMRKWERDGSAQAQVSSDMLGRNITKSPAFRPMARMAQKAYEAGASVFGAAEVTNRMIAGLVAYRLAKQPGALEKAKRIYAKDELFREKMGGEVTPEKLAEWAILESQFETGKLNTPEIMRGAGAPLFQFKKFTGNYLSLLHQQFRYEGASGKVAGTMMLASLLGAAGLKGLPFAEDAMDAIDWATEFVRGVNPHVEMQIKQWLRDGLGKVGGERWAGVGTEMLMDGPSRYLTGASMGQRFGQGDLVPNNPADLLGPAAGAIAQAYDSAALRKAGQTYQAAEKVLPKGLGNIVGAAGYQDQGVTTKAGNRVMQPSEFTEADVAKKALGFQPAELARRQDTIFALSQVEADARKAAAGFYRRLANSLNLAEQHKDSDPAAAARYMRRFQDDLARYQRDIDDPSRPAYMKFRFNREALKREIGNAMDWSRRFAKGAPKVARPELMRLMQEMSRGFEGNEE